MTSAATREQQEAIILAAIDDAILHAAGQAYVRGYYADEWMARLKPGEWPNADDIRIGVYDALRQGDGAHIGLNDRLGAPR
jgi:hypothetical protein